ncbi:MAG: hypothetical protein HYY01_14425 [Chloroflexi bacterium]|nr:hypothetical protein [Chloroflexota bacterium]
MRAPLWVKIFGAILIVLVLVFVVLKLTGVGGEHGPRRHTPSGGAGGDTPPIQQVVQPDGPGGHTPPVEHGP